MADFDKVRRNVKKMVDSNAQEHEIDTYLGSEGLTAEQLRAAPKAGIDRTFGGDTDLQQQYDFRSGRNSRGPSQEKTVYGAIDRGLTNIFGPINRAIKPLADYAERAQSSALMGAKDEITAGIGAVGDTITGNRGLGENYDRRLKLERALRDDNLAATNGILGTAADIAGAAMLMPARAVQVAGAIPAAIGTETWRQGVRRIAGEIASNVPSMAKAGALYGGANAFFSADGSQDPEATLGDNFEKRLSAVPAGAAEGAVMAPIIGGALHGAIGARGIRRGQIADRADRQMLSRMQWEAEGMSAPGYAITESPTARATAQGLSDSILGGSLRNDAAARTAALEARARQVTREQTGGAPSNDLGADLQNSIERNLHEYSTPNREVAGMPNSQLERISGPVTQEGFRPPRPQVDPIPPREVRDVTPEQFAAERLPGRVPQVEPKFDPIDPRSIEIPPELTVRGADFQSRVREFNRKFSPGEVHKSSIEVSVSPPMRREQIEADSIAARYHDIRSKYGRSEDTVPREVQDRLDRLATRHQQLTEAVRPMREEHAALLAERKALAAEIEDYVSGEFAKRSREAHAKAAEAAQQETLQQNARAETEYRP